MLPLRCSETLMESNCKGPRLGIFGGAGLAQAPPPAPADWSLGGEVNNSSAVSQGGQLVQYSDELRAKWEELRLNPTFVNRQVDE